MLILKTMLYFETVLNTFFHQKTANFYQFIRAKSTGLRIPIEVLFQKLLKVWKHRDPICDDQCITSAKNKNFGNDYTKVEISVLYHSYFITTC